MNYAVPVSALCAYCRDALMVNGVRELPPLDTPESVAHAFRDLTQPVVAHHVDQIAVSEDRLQITFRATGFLSIQVAETIVIHYVKEKEQV